tara:strand:+ start:1344 stop:1859 length:516 start_codon:yes stop_codon:yes gene_type:complete
MNNKFHKTSSLSRSAARLAAVQALYQIEESNISAENAIEEFLSYRIGKGLGENNNYQKVDTEYFSLIVTGVSVQLSQLDNELEKCISVNWNINRLGPLMHSLLRAGIFELLNRPDIPVKVVISEYIELSHDFFDSKDSAFVNAVLDCVSKKLKSDTNPKVRGLNGFSQTKQ